MNNLLTFFTRNSHWMLFLLLELISVVLLFRYNNYQGSVWVSSANSVTGKVYEWESQMKQFFSLTERSQQLTMRNVYLEQELTRLRQELTELKNDTLVADSVMNEALRSLNYIPAKVVACTLNRPDNLLTIDRGTEDGVKPDMGVVCGAGVVGVVYMAGSHYAVVIPVLNTHSRISCAIRSRGYFGYLIWDGKSAVDAYMEDIPRHAQFAKGDTVETSGYSSIFPPGFTVGRITDISNSADGLSYRLKIRLSTDFGCLRDVCVLDDPSIAERLQLLQAARDSLTQKQ